MSAWMGTPLCCCPSQERHPPEKVNGVPLTRAQRVIMFLAAGLRIGHGVLGAPLDWTLVGDDCRITMGIRPNGRAGRTRPLALSGRERHAVSALVSRTARAAIRSDLMTSHAAVPHIFRHMPMAATSWLFGVFKARIATKQTVAPAIPVK